MSSKPVLKRNDDGTYQIPGFDDLHVEPCYDYGDDRRKPELYGWVVIDRRYHALDRGNRWRVIFRDRLAEIRQWVAGGGPGRWEPDKRLDDRRYEP